MLKGIGCSDGFGTGRVLIVREQSLEFTPRTGCDPSEEFVRYRDAVGKFCLKTDETAQKLRLSAGEKEAEIILGHIMMIEDPFMNGEIEKLIERGQCAESALSSICDMFAEVFMSSGDELTMQRASDVNDIKNSILSILLGCEETDLSEVPPDTVIVARDLTPSMTAGINRNNIVGIITETGGRTSHSAILARAMEIPAVLSVPGVVTLLNDGDTVIVDGFEGEVIEFPDDDQIKEYAKRHEEFDLEKRSLQEFIEMETATADGIELELAGNIGKPDEAETVLSCGGDGIGLFRTEFLFMDRQSEPTEEEQFEAYKKAALIMKGRPVIIRTLDVGGDKDISYLNIPKEENPFLGFRAVRYCLKNRELYTAQLRALIRAGAYGDIRIMVPFVSRVDELREVRGIIRDIMDGLESSNIPYNKDMKVGVMIETAAAAVMADVLAEEADFFSIGTNDLIQYTMAADRGNADAAYLYSVYDPAVLRSLRHIISEGRKAGIPVGMCGEAASDRLMIPLLISFGLSEFSVGAASILRTRKEISRWTKASADALAEKVMALATESEVEELLRKSVI